MFLRAAQSFTQVSFLEASGRDLWQHVCEFAFKRKDEMAEAKGNTMFEKLQVLESKETTFAFSAVVDGAKSICATELAPEDSSPNCELALKAHDFMDL